MTILLVDFTDKQSKELESYSPNLRFECCEHAEIVGRLDHQKFELILIRVRGEGRETLAFLESKRAEAPVAVALSPESRAITTELVALGVTRLFQKLDMNSISRGVSELLNLSTPGLSLFPESERRDPLKALRLQFIQSTIALLEDVHQWSRAGRLPADRESCRRELHKLVGNLGAFGFPNEVGRARKLEYALMEPNLTKADLTVLELTTQEILDGLRDGAELPPAPAPKKLRKIVAVCSRDQYLAIELARELERQGYFSITTTPIDLAKTVQKHNPEALIMDFSGLDHSVLGLFTTLTKSTTGTIIALDEPMSIERRVALTDSGATLVLEKPVSVDKVVEMLMNEISAPSFTNILAMDDDPVALARLESLLLPLKARFKGVSTARHLWEALEIRIPDLLILDIDMPVIDGLSLCRAVRSDSRFHQIPIVFLTSSNSSNTRQEAFQAGADDLISKCAEQGELRNRLLARLARNRVSRQLEADRLTGLLTRTPASERITNLFVQSRRRELPTALAVLDLDHFKSVNDKYGHPAGDRVLKRTASLLLQHFRSQDVVARWGGEEFVIALYAMSGEEAVRRLEQVLDKVKSVVYKSDQGEPFRLSFSAGVAEYPRDGNDLSTLFKRADVALYRAKEEGRSKVVQVNTSAKEAAPFDVVLLEDDHPLGSVILDKFRQIGLNALWFQSRAEALVAFQSGIKTKVLLLDQDLPDGSGLQLLEEIAEPKLSQTSVIMLSGRMSEEEVLQSFELGAEDHLSKPFFLPVLLRRLEKHFGAAVHV